MWISRKKWNLLGKRVADLEMEVQGQRIKNEITFEFCRSVANKEKLSLLSYQQLHSPSTDSSQKVRMLLEEIRKLAQKEVNNKMRKEREDMEEEKLCLVKEMSIQRLEVEKFCVAIKQLVDPLELGKKTRIIAEYDPKLPTIKIHFYSEQ